MMKTCSLKMDCQLVADLTRDEMENIKAKIEQQCDLTTRKLFAEIYKEYQKRNHA